MSTDLVAAQPLLPLDPATAEQVMQRYQETTAAWLDPSDWIGAPGATDSFVKKSGWEKIATAYSLSTSIISQTIERDTQDHPIRAHAIVRATAPTGRYRDGDGGCGINEPRFHNPNGRQKVEHDLPATAVTRATNRAISNLVGFGQVSAEEVDADLRISRNQNTPPWAAYADDQELTQTAGQLVEIMQTTNSPTSHVKTIGSSIRDECGDIPQCVVHTVALIHAALTTTKAYSEPVEGGEQP